MSNWNWNPLGNHVQNGRSDPEHVHVERAKVGKFTTSSALDSFGLADQWQKNGMPFPIYRDYNLELSVNGKYNTAQKVYDEITRVGRQNPFVYWNISCEVDMTDWLYQLYIDLMDMLADDIHVIGVVMSNAAYLPSWWDAAGNHYERPMAKKYLQKLWDLRHVKNSAGHPAFIHGDHFYTSGWWSAFCNAGEFLNDPQSAFSSKWETGEYHIDWSKPQWHFNKIQGIKDALGWRWDNAKREWVAKDGITPTADLPWMIITEELMGSMSIPDLLKAYPNWVNTPPWNRDIRGYRANTNQWQEWYKEPVGLVLTKMRSMTFKHIYRDLKTVLGTTHFAAGNTGGPWDADNTTGDTDYNESVVNVRLEVPYFEGVVTPPPPPPDPDPVPVPDPPPAGTIDMREYLLGDPSRIFSNNRGEWCQTQFTDTDKKHGYFVKNGNSEEFGFTETAVLRGTDTSEAETYYQVWQDGKLGAVWCPRYWNGDKFKRTEEVRIFYKSDGRPKHPPYPNVSYLEIVARHATYTFPSGITLPDVIELVWYFEGQAIPEERYFYAKGWGLVGFKATSTGFSGYVSNLNETKAPVRKTWPGIVPMQLPAPVVTPNPATNDPRFAPYRVTTVASGGANVRQRPSTDAAIVGSIASGGVEIAHIPYEALTTAEKAVARPADGFEWYCVRVVRSGKQYVGWTRSDVVSKPEPVVVEPPPINEDLAAWLAAEEGALAETDSLLNHLTPALAIAQSRRLTHVKTIAYLKAKMEEAP